MILNTFRASLSSSSGGQFVYLQYLVSSHSAIQCTDQEQTESALNRCTGWQHTECDNTRYCKYTNCLPEDEHSDARNMLRITMQCYYRINRIVH
jgi:hypothetical protein